MSATVCPGCGIDISRLAPCTICRDGMSCCPCVHEDDKILRTTRKTSSYLLTVRVSDDDRIGRVDRMVRDCPVPVDTSGIGDGQSFIRYRASSDADALSTAWKIVPDGAFYLSTGYGAHFRPVTVA